MPTTGQINQVTLSTGTIITDALEDLRVILDGATPSTGDFTKGLRKINMILKKWAVKGALLWCRDTIEIPLDTNQYKYTIGPGADVDTYRPLRAFDTSFIRQTCGVDTAIDVPLTLLSRKEYMQMSSKATLGTPNSFYYDPQMAQSPFQAYDPYANAWGWLYVWTAPVDMTRTVFLDVQRPIQDVTQTTDLIDIPLEWYETMSLTCKAALADAFEVPENRLMRIKKEADDAVKELSDWGATEQAPITFQPDWRWTNLRWPSG
jgi:hypothetical protein